MQRLCSSLTAVVLLAHALLGCCWHHAHACLAEPAAAICSGHAGHSHEHATPPSSERHQEHQHECEATACVFDRAVSPQVAESRAAWPMQPAHVALASDALLAPSDWTAVVDPDPFGRPVRLHLLHQILLI